MRSTIGNRIERLEANAALRGDDEYDRWLAALTIDEIESAILRSDVAAELQDEIDSSDPINQEIVKRLGQEWSPPLSPANLKEYSGMTEHELKAELAALEHRMHEFASPEQLAREERIREKWRRWYLDGIPIEINNE